MSFKETLNEVKDDVKDLMTEENISDEKLAKLTSLNEKLNELDKQHQTLAENHAKMKDKYIESVMNYGTSKEPKDETGGATGRSLEEIAGSVLAKK